MTQLTKYKFFMLQSQLVNAFRIMAVEYDDKFSIGCCKIVVDCDSSHNALSTKLKPKVCNCYPDTNYLMSTIENLNITCVGLDLLHS